jgi:hypothetical protein
MPGLTSGRSARLAGVLVACLTLSIVARETAASKRADPTPEQMAQLWEEPTNLEARDLYWGPGGKALAPRNDVDYRFLELDDTGHSPGYVVEGPDGRRWKVKIGEEAQSEIVVSRILWASGYHQAATYYLPHWKMSGGPTTSLPPGRFRLESDHEKEGDWSWTKNPFVGTRPFVGLVIVNLVLNNWDLDRDNNRIYRPNGAGKRSTKWYVVQDVGGSLGKSTFPIGTRNRIDDFESQDLVKGIEGGRVKLDYRSYHRELVKDVAPEEVVWACRLLSRLSDRQLEDAFRAAEYPDAVTARYVRKIREKIRQGLALETRTESGG